MIFISSPFVEYQSFENKVITIANDADYQQHGYMLSSLHQAYRGRCIDTLALGFNIPDTVSHINKASKLPEKNYSRYIKYIYNQKSGLNS